MKKEHLTHPLLDKEHQFRLFAKFSSSFTCICSLTFADRVSNALLNSFCLVFGAVKSISHTGL